MGERKHEHVRVAVIGSGFGGLGAAVRLRREGITDFVVLERADSVGGTWRDNSYPGCACDVPSHLYSFSFAPNPDWPRTFSGQPHIRAYLEHVADTFGLRPHIRLNHEVQRHALGQRGAAVGDRDGERATHRRRRRLRDRAAVRPEDAGHPRARRLPRQGLPLRAAGTTTTT